MAHTHTHTHIHTFQVKNHSNASTTRRIIILNLVTLLKATAPVQGRSRHPLLIHPELDILTALALQTLPNVDHELLPNALSAVRLSNTEFVQEGSSLLSDVYRVGDYYYYL